MQIGEVNSWSTSLQKSLIVYNTGVPNSRFEELSTSTRLPEVRGVMLHMRFERSTRH